MALPEGPFALLGRGSPWHGLCVATYVAESLLIGLSALQAHKRAMEVTSHNVANATTPGFSRQRAELQAPVPEDFNPGQLGRGVDVQAIRRIVDTLTDERLRASASEVNRLKTLRDNLKTIELVFNEPGENGLGGVTDRLFNVLGDLSNNPESGALRSAVVQELQTWTATVNDLADRLDLLRQDVRATIDDQLRGVNQLTEQIADLNRQIRRQTASGNSPNDLMDSRDRLIEELSGFLELRVRRNPGDNSVQIDAGGVQLVGIDSATNLRADVRPDGGLSVLTPNGGILKPRGGSLAALDELETDIIPGVVTALDTMTATIARRLNGLHATATSQAMRATSFQGAYTIPTRHLTTDLDSPQLMRSGTSELGLPALFGPSFSNAAGDPEARNLTINLLDTASGEARKYVVRYDPQTSTGTKSLEDLVRAINTGNGGGFTVLGSDGIGIPGLAAKAVQVDGGYQLQLTADTGLVMDFSPALDLRPATQQWSGPEVQVSTITNIPLAVGSRLQFEVARVSPLLPDLQLRITTRNPADGTTISLGDVPLVGPLPTTISVPGIGGSGELSVTLDDGDYRIGERFVVELNSAGSVVENGSGIPGLHLQATERTAGDAGFAITGRYTGQLGLAPDGGAGQFSTWAMRVITGGTVGATATSDPADPQPPVVEFDYWTGAPASPTRQTVRMTLDQRLPAGTPVQIAEGVYARFDAGDLTATATGMDTRFIVDARPDEAGLLTALGINGMFTGDTAGRLRVAAHLAADPTQLSTGLSRAEGDNTNALRLLAARTEKLYNDGAFGLDETYTAILSDVGIRIRQADRLNDNQSNIRAALQNQRQQMSGINIDEEIGLLVMQQQAYTAAARVITFARENIQTLLDLAR